MSNDYECKICIKKYKSYQTLWKHNKKFHKTKIIITPLNTSSVPQNTSKKVYKCKYCEKNYSRNDNLKRHENTCKQKTISENNNEIKQQLVSLTKDIEILKNKCKKKITNNNNNNGIINNNITINKLGNENISLLNNDEIIKIFNKELESIITFIEIINFNDRLKENHSYCVTSLESKFLSTYNDETKKIDKDRKKYFFDKILNSSIEKMEILYHSNQKLFNKYKQNQIQNSIDNIKSLKNFDFNNKLIKEVHNKINLISYNNRDIIQKIWYDPTDPDEDGEGTFQDDLNRIEQPLTNNILKLCSSDYDSSSKDTE
jgi:hypothetical protein